MTETAGTEMQMITGNVERKISCESVVEEKQEDNDQQQTKRMLKSRHHRHHRHHSHLTAAAATAGTTTTTDSNTNTNTTLCNSNDTNNNRRQSTLNKQVKVKREMFGAQGAFECPCYKYSARTDRYIIFMVNLKCTMEKNPQFWTLRGTALLCNTD